MNEHSAGLSSNLTWCRMLEDLFLRSKSSWTGSSALEHVSFVSKPTFQSCGGRCASCSGCDSDPHDDNMLLCT